MKCFEEIPKQIAEIGKSFLNKNVYLLPLIKNLKQKISILNKIQSI